MLWKWANMRLSVKYFLAFLIVSLIPLIVVGSFTFYVAREQLESRTINSLESLAVVQENRIIDNIDHDFEQINSVTSQTQLRNSIQSYNLGDKSELNLINKIIDDADESSNIIANISIFDLDGNIITSTNEDRDGGNVTGEEFFEEGKEGNGIHEFFKDENGSIFTQLSGPFSIDGELLGIVEIMTDASPLISIIEDFSGLGKTGESILVQKNENGDAVFLSPIKYDPDAALTRTVDKEQVNVPVTLALQGKEITLTDGKTIDYRGEAVIAVTKHIDSQNWGIVVKIDRSEAFASINVISQLFAFVFVATLVLVIFVSILLSRGIIKPIKSLTLFAQKLEKGALHSRVKPTSSVDEIDQLSTTLNSMAEEIHKSHQNLELKVEKRTKDLEQTRAMEEAMLASIGDGLIVTDKKKKILLANKAAEGMIGYKEKELLGKDWTKISGLKDNEGNKLPDNQIPINKVLKKENVYTTSTSDPYNITRKNGAPFPVAITATKLLVDDKTIGAVIVFRDITKDRSIDQAKTEFVSLASHQLRTPLSAISWYAEMLKDGDTGKMNKEQLKLLDEIYVGNQRMIDLVNSLLNVSRLELGTFIVEPEPTDLTKLTQSVIKEMTPKIRDKQHEIIEKYANLPKFNLDPKLTRIIIQNLISNSVKYSPPKSKIEIYINKLKKGQPADGRVATKDSIYIKVTDNGFGIPRREQKMVFQKMFRAENIRTKNAEGTGLGIYIIKQIVEQGEGEIWFESKENKGTTFFVMLPLSGMKKKGGSKSLESDISVTDLQDDNKKNLTKLKKKVGKVIKYDESDEVKEEKTKPKNKKKKSKSK